MIAVLPVWAVPALVAGLVALLLAVGWKAIRPRR
jgi:hypothetical protein